ncbi:helix-turn-helix domain-containing protein [Aestuariispira insulae]|uniref:helix-turn-helix domain-containing protein n=1 Tax=Aestuariispira insulae TaxID=1461337 RepID=UPI001FE39490|nr:AraC family transcriptional regulator [Aestuariispira insulae]
MLYDWEIKESERTLHFPSGRKFHALTKLTSGGSNYYRKFDERAYIQDNQDIMHIINAKCENSFRYNLPSSGISMNVTPEYFSRLYSEATDDQESNLELREDATANIPMFSLAFENILGKQDWGVPSCGTLLSECCHALLYSLIRDHKPPKSQRFRSRGKMAPAPLKRVRDYIEANISDTITIDRLAEIAGLSSFHFARQFKASLGEPPHTFVMKQRLSLARSLLIKTSLSVTEIAHHCGFSSHGHLSKRIKQETGLSPVQFRAANCR